MKTIAPVETKYGGHRFRSRLEARWAVFFDALRVSYAYEAEGYDCEKFGWYLPDFVFPDTNSYVEVKAAEGGASDEKAAYFAARYGKDFAFLYGQPGKHKLEAFKLGNLQSPFRAEFSLCLHEFGRGGIWLTVGHLHLARVHAYAVTEKAWAAFGPHTMDEYKGALVQQALDAASMARFEHGESG